MGEICKALLELFPPSRHYPSVRQRRTGPGLTFEALRRYRTKLKASRKRPRHARCGGQLVLSSEACSSTVMNQVPPNPDSDEKLVRAFLEGFSDAFSALFRRYRTAIHGFFRRRVTDPARAEELTQETFLS